MDNVPISTPAVEAPAIEANEAPVSTEAPETSSESIDAKPIQLKKTGEKDPKLDAAAKIEKRLYKLKYGDKEEEVDEAEVVRRAQKVTGIEKKAEEAAKQYKTATSLFRLLKEDPLNFAKRAKEVGIDPEALAVEIINNKLKYEQMSPEQRELEQLRQEKIERAAQDKVNQENEHQRLIEEQTEEYRQSLEKEIIEAYQEVKLPKTSWTTARIAAYLDAGLANGKQYKVKDVAAQVKKEYYSAINEILGAAPEDQILDLLKPEVLENITRARVKKLQPKAPPPAAPKQEEKKKEPKLDPRKAKLIRQYIRNNDYEY